MNLPLNAFTRNKQSHQRLSHSVTHPGPAAVMLIHPAVGRNKLFPDAQVERLGVDAQAMGTVPATLNFSVLFFFKPRRFKVFKSIYLLFTYVHVIVDSSLSTIWNCHILFMPSTASKHFNCF